MKVNNEKIDIKLLIKLTVPIFFELILTILLGSIDKIMVRDDASANAIEQANAILSMFTVVISVLASGSIILISHFKGANDKIKENKIYSLSLFFNILMAFCLGLILFLFAKPIFLTMNVDEKFLNDAIIYLKINGIFLFLQAFMLTMSAFLRSNELAFYSLINSIVLNVVNISLNALFLYVLKMHKTTGVAIATVISKICSCCILFIIFKKKMKVKLNIKELFESKKELKTLLKISLPSSGELLSYAISQIVILSFINIIGSTINSASPTAKTYSSIMIQFTYIFVQSLSQGMQILLGRYLGQNNTLKAKKLVFNTLVIGISVSLFLAIIQALFAKNIFALFTGDDEVIKLCVQIMTIEIILEIGRAMNNVMVKSLQTSGDVIFPTIISIVFCWLVAVLLGYILGVTLKMGIAGIWIAMALDENIRGLIYIFRWKKGLWVKNTLIK